MDAAASVASAQLRNLQGECSCSSACGDLAGIPVGGWIAISITAGMLAGMLGTLVVQRCLLQRPAAHAAPSPLQQQQQQHHHHHHHLNQLAAGVPAGGSQPATLPQRTPEPCFSPLLRSSGNLPAGSLGSLSSVPSTGKASRPRDADACDADQTAAALQMQPLDAWGRQQEAAAHKTLTVAPISDTIPSADAADRPEEPQLHHPAAAHQPPASLPSHHGAAPPRQQLQQQQQAPGGAAQQAAATAAAAAAGQAPGGGQSQQPPCSDAAGRPPAGAAGGSGRAGAQVDVEDEYEDEELDEDWRALLGGVDQGLLSRGAPPLDAKERAIAMRTLLTATHSRGRAWATRACAEEVLRLRAFHQQRRGPSS